MMDVTSEHSMRERHKEIEQQTHQAIKLRRKSSDKVCLLLKCEDALTFCMMSITSSDHRLSSI